MTFLGRGVVQIAMAIAIVNVPIFARLLRSSLLGLREADYVVAARSVGVRGPTTWVTCCRTRSVRSRAGDAGAGDGGDRRG